LHISWFITRSVFLHTNMCIFHTLSFFFTKVQELFNWFLHYLNIACINLCLTFESNLRIFFRNFSSILGLVFWLYSLLWFNALVSKWLFFIDLSIWICSCYVRSFFRCKSLVYLVYLWATSSSKIELPQFFWPFSCPWQLCMASEHKYWDFVSAFNRLPSKVFLSIFVRI